MKNHLPDNFYVGGYRYNQRANQMAFVGLNSHELLQGNYVKGKLAVQVQPMPNLFVSALANLIFVSDDNYTLLRRYLSHGTMMPVISVRGRALPTRRP